jgi:glycosyltransferase involved in cell wall biosynthesis
VRDWGDLHILLMYPRHKGTTGDYVEKALKLMGVDVYSYDLFQTRDLSFFCSHHIYPFWEDLRNVTLSKIVGMCEHEPDLVIEVDGAGCHRPSEYNKISIPKVYWGIDSHIKLAWHKRLSRETDYLFLAQKDYLSYFSDTPCKAEWLPLAADPDIHSGYSVPKLFDIGFVGSLLRERHPERVRLLSLLQNEYSVLAVDGIFGIDMAKVYNLARIGFNKSINGDLNMRVFEVLCSGTMLLTDKIGNGLDHLFENRKHLVTYADDTEMEKQTEYFLEKEDERERIARAGRQEVIEKHTYAKRIERMLSVFF